MTLVNVLNVKVLNNPSPFTAPFAFEITFECLADLKMDLEWKLVYVGSAEDEGKDQVLDIILVGPVPVGVNRFTFQAPCPNVDGIPNTDILGVTVILLICSYREQEFIRIGYYVNNEYSDPELNENPPDAPLIERITRNILREKPRVTKIPIVWDSELRKETEFTKSGENVQNNNTESVAMSM